MERLPCYIFRAPSIHIVSRERMAEISHVDADLVRPACFERKLRKRMVMISRKRFIVRNSPLPAVTRLTLNCMPFLDAYWRVHRAAS